MWTRKAAGFLKRNQKILSGKKVSLFASGLSCTDPEQREYGMKTYLEKVAARYPSIRPISMGLFGGYLDFKSPHFMIRFVGGAMKKDLLKKGIDTSKPYDSRDFEAIRQWATDVAAKAQ